MRRKTRLALSLSMLIVLGLITGCYKEVAPDVTATSGAGAQAALPEEEMPDLASQQATAIAESTRVAEMSEETLTAEATTPTPTSTPTPEPDTPVPTTLAPTTAPTTAPTLTPSPPTSQVIHVVRRGENLFRIALRYGTTVQAIANANSIANPALIYVGQKLIIPSQGAQPPASSASETTYVVKAGDNLFRIALRYNMGYLYLAQYNGITNPSSIYVGQVLRIPPH